MYSNAKSCIRTSAGETEFFPCSIGVRQGDNLSPLLFALYLNDLEDFIKTEYKGLSYLSDLIHSTLDTDEISIFLKLYLLLYADDTIILAESVNDLQKALNKLHDYCQTWGLSINTDKTKVVVFAKGKIRIKPVLKLNNKELEVVPSYKYLGLEINYNGTFMPAIKRLCNVYTSPSSSRL